MTSSPLPSLSPAELEQMLSALVDGTLSQDDQAWLDQLIVTDPAVRAEYRDFMRTEFLLAWEIGYGANRPHVPFDGGSQPDIALSPSSKRTERWLGWRRAGAWLLPLSLAAAVGAFVVFIAGWAGPAQLRFAKLTDSDGARWADAAVRHVGGLLSSGPLHLAEGTAQLTFESGAVVTMHAPAETEILGANRVFLRSGRITPFVPPSAKGFTVVSPTGEVIDLGTEFSIGVGPDGKTDVFVIDGEVDVKGGHGVAASPVRLTQGYATEVRPGQTLPRYTQQPLVIDHFGEGDGGLQRIDIDAGRESVVRNGALWIPIEGRPGAGLPLSRTVLDNDFSAMAGRRSMISMKVTLPDVPGAARTRWLAMVIDDGSGEPPRAGHQRTHFAVIVSPHWQIGTRYSGETGFLPRVFARNEDAVGPYQVVVTIDDSPAMHSEVGSAAVTLMVNGRELVKDRPIAFSSHPRLALQTWDESRTGHRSHAVVDDFSVSIEESSEPQ